MEIKQYLEMDDDNICPHCESVNVDVVGEMLGTCNRNNLEMECQTCSATWISVYKFIACEKINYNPEDDIRNTSKEEQEYHKKMKFEKQHVFLEKTPKAYFRPDDELTLMPEDKEGFWHFEESDDQLKITRVKK